MNLSFSIQIVANGYVVNVSRSNSVHSMGQSQIHVFNTPEETEAFVRQVANDFKVNQVDGDPMVNPAWHHGDAVTNSHPDWNHIVSHITTQQVHQDNAAPIGVTDDFDHPVAAPNQGPAPMAGNVFPHNQGN